MAQAQLIAGPTGYGGLPLALAMAQRLVCLNPIENDSCGACTGCRAAEAMQHPDIHYSFPMVPKKPGDKPKAEDYYPEWRAQITRNPYISYGEWMEAIDAGNKQGNINADECRAILRKLRLMPVLGGYRVVIIHLAEYLGKEGNILLKILEEPPADTVFLLTTESPDEVLPTIRSRTRQMHLHPLKARDIEAGLADRGLEPEGLQDILLRSNGDFGLAINMANGETGEALGPIFMDWMRQCYRPSGPQMLSTIEKLDALGREKLKAFFETGIGLMRESLLAFADAPALHRASGPAREFAERFSKLMRGQDIAYITKRLDESAYHIERNAHGKLLLLELSLDIYQRLRSVPK